MRSILLTVLLILLNWTASYAQTGDTTTQCYNRQELERIADRVVYARECDTLLNVCEEQLQEMKVAVSALESESAAKDSVIAAKNESLLLKEDIITGYKVENLKLEDALKKSERKRKWTKLGWIGTSVIFTGVLTYFIIH